MLCSRYQLAARDSSRSNAGPGRCGGSASRTPGTAAGALVDLSIEHEVARVAGRRNEVAQRAAADADRLGQDVAHRRSQPFAARPAEAMRRRARVDASAKQRFGRVDIADADDDVTREQHLLDGRGALPRLLVQDDAIESRVEWLDTQAASSGCAGTGPSDMDATAARRSDADRSAARGAARSTMSTWSCRPGSGADARAPDTP